PAPTCRWRRVCHARALGRGRRRPTARTTLGLPVRVPLCSTPPRLPPAWTGRLALTGKGSSTRSSGVIPEIDVPGGDFTAVSVVFAAATIDNGTLIVHGLANATSVNAGGVQTVLAGGIDQGAQISGGIEQVLAGGSASGTIVNSGGSIELFGGTADVGPE